MIVILKTVVLRLADTNKWRFEMIISNRRFLLEKQEYGGY